MNGGVLSVGTTLFVFAALTLTYPERATGIQVDLTYTSPAYIAQAAILAVGAGLVVYGGFQ